MHRARRRSPRLLLAASLLFALATTGARAQSGGAYSIQRATLSAGGVTASSGGAYQLGATAGQPITTTIAGGVYSMTAGMWVPSPAAPVAVRPPDHPWIPTAVGLVRLSPNPFREGVRFAVDLPTALHVHLVVFTVAGHRVRDLEDRVEAAGRHVVAWDGTDASGRTVASGVYLLRLEAAGTIFQRRVARVG